MTKYFNLVNSFIYKEIKTIFSYKFHFVIKFLFLLVQLIIFYYFCSLISKDYFKFLFLGLLFSKIFSHTTTLLETIKQDQFAQTIYITFSFPYSEFTILLCNFCAKTTIFLIELLIFIIFSILFFNIKLNLQHLIFLIFFTIYTIIIFLWYTIVSSSLTFLIKKSEHLLYLINSLIDILSGVYFPISVLPPILQNISYLLPTTYLLSFLRNTISQSKITYELLFYPTIFGFILLPISILIFNFVLKRMLKIGRLAIY